MSRDHFEKICPPAQICRSALELRALTDCREGAPQSHTLFHFTLPILQQDQAKPSPRQSLDNSQGWLPVWRRPMACSASQPSNQLFSSSLGAVLRPTLGHSRTGRARVWCSAVRDEVVVSSDPDVWRGSKLGSNVRYLMLEMLPRLCLTYYLRLPFPKPQVP